MLVNLKCHVRWWVSCVFAGVAAARVLTGTLCGQRLLAFAIRHGIKVNVQ